MSAVAAQSSHLFISKGCGSGATCAPLFVSNYDIGF